jgi:MFS family permease
MVSLVTGIVFSFTMGSVIDGFEAKGNLNGAFIVCGLGVFGLMLLHSATLVFSLEKPAEQARKVPTKTIVKDLLKDKTLFKVILISVIWGVANHVATPFYGAYQIDELGFTMTFVSVLSAAYAVVRTLFSRPMGRFADKHSFAKMLNICFIIVLVAFSINIFTVPSNGKILYTAYYVLYAIAMAGINSSMINLIYDYVDKEKRVGALALNGTLSGVAGFFATLAVTPLVSYVQNNGNRLFGINIYAQQALSALAVVLVAVLIIYLNLVVRKIDKRGED